MVHVARAETQKTKIQANDVWKMLMRVYYIHFGPSLIGGSNMDFFLMALDGNSCSLDALQAFGLQSHSLAQRRQKYFRGHGLGAGLDLEAMHTCAAQFTHGGFDMHCLSVCVLVAF